jgi:hypothetical protein
MRAMTYKLRVEEKDKPRIEHPNDAIVRPSPLPDSNRRPLPYHGSALPAELRGQGAGV